MSKIIVLPDGLKDKIRAGEVVERPASVVKELIENSLDAGSKNISIEILRGGIKLISVSDDGEGMEGDDALLSLKRHATSKISSADDLFNIRTLGFRGEALPSIASVSRLTLLTAPKGSSSGVSISVEGGSITDVRDAPGRGTSIEVRDLFFNTPARRKFLKSPSTELLHIINTVTKYALSFPDAGFGLKAEGHESIALPPASGLRERLMQIYGGEFLDGLIEMEDKEGDMRLKGFFSSPANLRNSKFHQFIFINGRPVRDSSILHAIYHSYDGILHKGRHPIFFIFAHIDPAKVDFNVHPAKQEVRFQDKDSLYKFLLNALRGAQSRKKTEDNITPWTGETSVSYPPATGIRQIGEFSVSEAVGELSYGAEVPFIYIGETFVAFSGKGSLTLLDHHAAHERVLYEKLLSGIDLNSYRLLFPKQATLSHREYMVIVKNIELLSEFGLEVEDFGKDTVIVRSIPEALNEADIRVILLDVAGAIEEGTPPGKTLKEDIAAKVACHSSIRGRRILGKGELLSLLESLEKTENPGQCPHGRPTRITYSMDELKRLFKRK
jgi:DNA mismatch repair protein MutL